jgi:hypothetical protein
VKEIVETLRYEIIDYLAADIIRCLDEFTVELEVGIFLKRHRQLVVDNFSSDRWNRLFLVCL